MQRLGNIITTPAIAAKLPKKAFAIKTWDNDAYKTKTYAAIKALDLWLEPVYSVSTRGYVLFVLADRSQRMKAFELSA